MIPQDSGEVTAGQKYLLYDTISKGIVNNDKREREEDRSSRYSVNHDDE